VATFYINGLGRNQALDSKVMASENVLDAVALMQLLPQ
jgi:hypothetical protein